jgi:hypothetical protein
VAGAIPVANYYFKMQQLRPMRGKKVFQLAARSIRRYL